MKRIITTLALLAAPTVLSGCVFAVGSTHESQPKDRLDRLESRISTVEKELGIQPPPASSGAATEARQ